MDDRAAITQFMTLTSERHRDWNTVSLELIRAMTVFPKFLSAFEISLQEWQDGSRFVSAFGGDFEKYVHTIRLFAEGVDQIVTLLDSEVDRERRVMERILRVHLKLPEDFGGQDEEFLPKARRFMEEKVQQLQPFYCTISDLRPVILAKRPEDQVADFMYCTGQLPYFALDVIRPVSAQPLLRDIWNSLADRWLEGDDPLAAAPAYDAYLKIVHHEGLQKMYLWGL